MFRGFGFLGACLLAASLAGAVRGQPTLVILGSSTAAGTGATNKDSSWAGRYAKALKERSPSWNVVNLGVGGYTTFHIRPTGAPAIAGRPAPDTAKNITKAVSLKPKGIFINLPSNDAASGYPAAQQKANYDTVAALCARYGIALWVCTSQPRTALVGDSAKKAALVEVKDWILVRFGAKAVDFWSGLARADAGIDPIYNSGDGIHLNDRGHKLLFERAMAEQAPEVLEAITSLAPSPARAGGSFRLGLPAFGRDALGRPCQACSENGVKSVSLSK